MGKVTLNPDLKRERERGTFDIEELTNLIDGGKIKTQERRELVEFFTKDPGFNDEVPPEYLSYVDRYEESVRKSCLMIYKINDWMNHKRTGSSVDLYQSHGPSDFRSSTRDGGMNTGVYSVTRGVEGFGFSVRKMWDQLGSEDSDSGSTSGTVNLEGKEKGVDGFYSLQDSLKALLGGMLGSAVLKDGMPFALHYVMFVPTIMGQGTMDQQAYWIGRAWNCSIMGTYAQTELGHGTFIRGLETTAHYDPETEEFILNSPTLTSYKWWPGGLGHTANYAIVLAQLHTKGKCYGIHPFIVQLRDEETHMPLKGIKIGEIGCKLGMNGTNQGFLGFDQVRIPREHMLMKNSQVLTDGTYVKSVSDKLTYGTMIFVRVALIRGIAASYLAKAVTIATRYSAVRHQSELIPGDGEPIIMEYTTQQYKLLPNIAASIGMMFASQWLWDMYNNVTSELEQGDIERLPELHAISCCLKSISTSDAARGIEECRKACGGHGYMTCSSFPITYGMATAAETYEGENTVLLLQTARYLLKANSMAKGGTPMPPTVRYLSEAHPMRLPWSNTVTSLVAAYRQVAQGLINETYEKVERLIASGTPSELAANHYSIQLVKCAEAHCRLFLVEKYFEAVKNAKVSQPLKMVLNELSLLYGVYYLLKDLGLFLSYSNVRITDVASIEEWQNSLLAALRPNAVSIVDSFDISDEILSSPLGAYDGDVYKRLMDEAMKSPLNKEPVNASFEKYLKPFLKSNM